MCGIARASPQCNGYRNNLVISESQPLDYRSHVAVEPSEGATNNMARITTNRDTQCPLTKNVLTSTPGDPELAREAWGANDNSEGKHTFKIKSRRKRWILKQAIY